MNKRHDTPLDGYMRHIAHANHIIYKEVLDNIQKSGEEWKTEKTV